MKKQVDKNTTKLEFESGIIGNKEYKIEII